MHSPNVFQEFCSIVRFLFGIFFSSAPSEMLTAIYWCVQNSSSRIPQTSASLKVQSDAECSKLAVQCTLDDPWTFYCFLAAWWAWEELQANFAYFLHFFTMCAVCFIVFIKSFVSCQALAEALKQNSTLTYLNLERNSICRIGPEWEKAWCLVRMGSWGERMWRKAKEGSRHSCLKVRSGKWRKATQCSIGAQMTQMCQIYHWSLWWQLIEDTENHQNWILAKEEIDSKKPL